MKIDAMFIKQKYIAVYLFSLVFALILMQTDTAWATQTHGEPEGLYVHQMAHLFFIISMGILEFWLRQRNLVLEPGWRYIQLAAVLLMLWNLDAIIVHFLAEQVDLLKMGTVDLWRIKITYAEGNKGIAILYYLAKLDHLLCVPAMYCMYLGLKKLFEQSEAIENS